jgi:hypothetical protein
MKVRDRLALLPPRWMGIAHRHMLARTKLHTYTRTRVCMWGVLCVCLYMLIAWFPFILGGWMTSWCKLGKLRKQHHIAMCNISLLCATSHCYMQHLIAMCNITLLCATWHCCVEHHVAMFNLTLLCAASHCYVRCAWAGGVVSSWERCSVDRTMRSVSWTWEMFLTRLRSFHDSPRACSHGRSCWTIAVEGTASSFGMPLSLGHLLQPSSSSEC